MSNELKKQGLETCNNLVGGERQVRAVKSWYIGYDFISIYPRMKRSDGKWFRLNQIEWVEIEPVVTATESIPEIRIDLTAAQQLMDDLWECGVRPTEGTESAGQSAAQQQHIKDLEQLTTRLLGIVEKQNDRTS